MRMRDSCGQLWITAVLCGHADWSVNAAIEEHKYLVDALAGCLECSKLIILLLFDANAKEYRSFITTIVKEVGPFVAGHVVLLLINLPNRQLLFRPNTQNANN